MVFAKRIQKLNKAGLQVKLILAFLLVASVSALFQVYLLNRFALVVSRKLPTDGDRMLSQLPEMLTTSLTLTFAVLVPGTFLVGLLITHRIAGPIHALERYIERHLAGEKQGPCTLRKGDELQELCELVNHALGKTQAQISSTSLSSETRDEAGESSDGSSGESTAAA